MAGSIFPSLSTGSSEASLKSGTIKSVGGGGAANPLDTAVWDLDITQAGSLTGNTWNDLSGNGNDFILGLTAASATERPTLSGSAGDSAAYFNLDGGDGFSLAPDAGATNPQHILDMSKTGSGNTEWWIAIAFQLGSLASFDSLFTTGDQSGICMTFYTQSDGDVSFVQDPVGGAFNRTDFAMGLTATTDSLLIISADMASGNARMWLNSTTAVENAVTLTASTIDGTSRAAIGAAFGGADTAFQNQLTNNTRVYASSGGVGFLSNSDVAPLFTTYNTRHDRTYA